MLAVASSASQIRSLILQRKLEEVEGYRRADFVAFLNRYNLGPSLSTADVERWQCELTDEMRSFIVGDGWNALEV